MKRVLLILLFLAGCSQLPFNANNKDNVNKTQHQPQAPDAITREATLLRSAGRWAESLALLIQASKEYPDNTSLEEALRQTQILHKYEIRRLEDEILLLDANALKEKASILQDLAYIDPGNYKMGTKLFFLDRERKRGVKGLVQCGRFHKWKNQLLSQHCLQLANQLNPSAEIQLLLDEVMQSMENEQSRLAQEKQFREKKRQKTKQALQEKKKKSDQIENSKIIERLLTAAKKSVEEGSYAMAAKTLDQIETMSPQDSRLHNLRNLLKDNIDKQVEQLVATGDRLYRDEQVDQAVAAWESALDLDPKREDVISKVERAMKIISRLKTLQVQKPEEKIN